MLHQGLRIAAVVVAGALLAQPVLAQEKTENPFENLTDNDFLIKAVTAGVAEVKLGETAQSNASRAEVKEFANRIVKDHKRANERLMEYAKGMKVAVVAGLEKPTREAIDRLSNLEGAAFDRAFLQKMVTDHEQAVKLFEAESRSAANPNLKTFARETLPTLKGHLEEARKLLGEKE